MKTLYSTLSHLSLISIFAASTASAEISPAPQTGEFEVTVNVTDIANPQTFGLYSDVYTDDDKISWNIYVPPNYDPDNPPGVVVHISPNKQGQTRNGWRKSLKDENFIYISANGNGNAVTTKQRMLNGILAAQYVSRTYKTDDKRTVIFGLDEGGAIASLLVENTPGVFEAGMFIGGALPWQGDAADIKARLNDGIYAFAPSQYDVHNVKYPATRFSQVYYQYRNAGLDNVERIDPIEGNTFAYTPARRRQLVLRDSFKLSLAYISDQFEAKSQNHNDALRQSLTP